MSINCSNEQDQTFKGLRQHLKIYLSASLITSTFLKVNIRRHNQNKVYNSSNIYSLLLKRGANFMNSICDPKSKYEVGRIEITSDLNRGVKCKIHLIVNLCEISGFSAIPSQGTSKLCCYRTQSPKISQTKISK